MKKDEHLNSSTNIPAGIFSGTELFTYNEEMYVLRNGERMLFQDLPCMEKSKFVQMYMNDRDGQGFIQKQFGFASFETAFKQWLFCKFGALDGNPDSMNGQITPDSYNSACQRIDCPGRGKICGSNVPLKGHQVETLRELKAGKTIKEIAESLCISEPAIKSRIEKMKDMFNVSNVVALIAITTELGI